MLALNFVGTDKYELLKGKHFSVLARVRKYRILIALCKKISMDCSIIFLDLQN